MVATLAAVEDTNPDLYVRLDADYDPRTDPAAQPFKPNSDNDNENDGEENEGSAPVPITNQLRTTIAHLRSRAGFWSRFRGFSVYLLYGIARGVLSVILPPSPQNFWAQLPLQVVLSVALANLHMTWVHIVISKPSTKRFYQRIPGRQSWVQIAPVAAAVDLATATAFYLPLMIAQWAGGFDSFVDNATSGSTAPASTMGQAWAITVLPSIAAYLVSIPAQAIFARVAASMLPDEDEAIVPFDRSFGGRVVPRILGGSGRLSIADAWRTFDRAARARYLKVIGKVLLMEFALLITFSLALMAQVSLLGVDTLRKLASS